MILTRELQIWKGAVSSSRYHQCNERMEDHHLRLYWGPGHAPMQRNAAGLVALMLITVLSPAGCADRPQAQHNEAHESCVIPRGGFDCGDKVKQEDNFMRFEQQGHQLP